MTKERYDRYLREREPGEQAMSFEAWRQWIRDNIGDEEKILRSANLRECTFFQMLHNQTCKEQGQALWNLYPDVLPADFDTILDRESALAFLARHGEVQPPMAEQMARIIRTNVAPGQRAVVNTTTLPDMPEGGAPVLMAQMLEHLRAMDNQPGWQRMDIWAELEAPTGAITFHRPPELARIN